MCQNGPCDSAARSALAPGESSHPPWPAAEVVEARIYERGVGVVPSSGTAAIAVAAACRSFKGAEEQIEVQMIGGSELVQWKGGGSSIRAISQIELICKGEIDENYQISSEKSSPFRSAA